MPLLYGEGRKAFRRLQEEILKIVEDLTIFAWPVKRCRGVLAPDPSFFIKPTYMDDCSWEAFSELRNSRTRRSLYHENEHQPTKLKPWCYSQLQRVDPRHFNHELSSQDSQDIDDAPRFTPRGICLSLPIFTSPVDINSTILVFLYSICKPDRQVVCLALDPDTDVASKGKYYERALEGIVLLDNNEDGFHLECKRVFLKPSSSANDDMEVSFTGTFSAG